MGTPGWFLIAAVDHGPLFDALAGIGALLAGAAALFQLFINFASGLQQQRLAQLAEALKNLGSENPRLRAGAAGTLGLIGRIDRAQLPFVTEELTIALSLEDDEDVMQAMQFAIASALNDPVAAPRFFPWNGARRRAEAFAIIQRARERLFWRWKMKLEDAIRQYGGLGWATLSDHVDGFSIPADAWARIGIADPVKNERTCDLAEFTVAERTAFDVLTGEAKRTKQRLDHLIGDLPIDRYATPR